MKNEAVKEIAFDVLDVALMVHFEDPLDFDGFMARTYQVFFNKLMETGKTNAESAQARATKFKSLMQAISFFCENSGAIDSAQETKDFYKKHVQAIFEKVDWSTDYDLVADYFDQDVA